MTSFPLLALFRAREKSRRQVAHRLHVAGCLDVMAAEAESPEQSQFHHQFATRLRAEAERIARRTP